MSKGALDIGSRKVIKKGKNQAIALAVGTKAVTQSGIVSQCSSLNETGYHLYDH
jgi:preprotein translocase subunit YajC